MILSTSSDVLLSGYDTNNKLNNLSRLHSTQPCVINEMTNLPYGLHNVIIKLVSAGKTSREGKPAETFKDFQLPCSLFTKDPFSHVSYRIPNAYSPERDECTLFCWTGDRHALTRMTI